ncbi:MAG: aminoacyl-tRNA hydrolase [Candidatus Yanofskybacteria bacterium]|nr:aminoacyl-tRNA hydrolase [Candidatus Yanofskybacteria bacterium]
MAIKLIIGIGNPDEQYRDTRHNVGFMMLDYIAKKSDSSNWEFNKKLNAEVVKCKLEKGSVVLAKAHTYVNKTGEAAVKLKNFYKVKSEQILVIQDDLDIPFENTKVSFDKNSGGHKGIESIMKALKTKKFYRLRIGLAKPALQKARQQTDKRRDEFVMKFVLSKFSPSEQDELKKIFKEGYEKLLQIN